MIEQGLEPELACKVIKLCPGKSFLVFTKDGNKYMYQNWDSNVCFRLFKFIIYKVVRYRKILLIYIVYFIFSLVKI